MKNDHWKSYFIDLKDTIKSRENLDINAIEKAFYFAAEAHKNQKRKTGESYIIHPVSVAKILLDMNADTHLVVAGLLHDTVEDTPVEREEIYQKFGKKVGLLVDAVSKNYSNFFTSFYQEDTPNMFSEYIDKVLWGGMQEIDVFFLKIADRKHNIQSLSALREEKQIKIAFETQAIYEPLEKILEIHKRESLFKKKEKFRNFLSVNNITNIKTLKINLLNFYFKGLQSGLFHIIHKERQNITWKVSHESLYRKMTSTPEIANKISFSKVLTHGDLFEAYFSYKKGFLLKDENQKITPFSYTSFL